MFIVRSAIILLVVHSTSCDNSYSSKLPDQYRSVKLDSTDEQDSATLFHLPLMQRSISEIDSLVYQIDMRILEEKLIPDYEFYDEDHQACEITKYTVPAGIIKMRFSCGDCSQSRADMQFYFYNDSLLFIRDRIVEFLYPPCAPNKELPQFGVDTLDIKKSQRERVVTYHLLSKDKFVTDTKGDSLSYESPDWTSLIDLLDFANELGVYRE